MFKMFFISKINLYSFKFVKQVKPHIGNKNWTRLVCRYGMVTDIGPGVTN